MRVRMSCMLRERSADSQLGGSGKFPGKEAFSIWTALRRDLGMIMDIHFAHYDHKDLQNNLGEKVLASLALTVSSI